MNFFNMPNNPIPNDELNPFLLLKRIENMENKIRKLEQRIQNIEVINNYDKQQEPDNMMYMI